MRALISILLVEILSSFLFAQSLPTIQPEKVGMSTERLQKIDKVFQQYVDMKKIAGVVELVMRKGKIVHYKVYGVSNIETKRVLQKYDLFRIASMTKPITSVALMTLYEDGRFLLNDNLSKYIPEFKNPKVLVKVGNKQYSIPANSEIKIRHILNHTAGFSYLSDDPIGNMYFEAGVTDGLSLDPLTIEETTKRIAKLPLRFHPGEQFHYSMAADIQGRLIEILSGMSLDNFFEEIIFKPLKMKDTHFFLPKEKVNRLVAVHEIKEGKVSGISDTEYGEPPWIVRTDYPYNGPQIHFAGGSGLSSTAEDYAKFCQMLLNGGKLDGVQILSRKTIEIMTTNTIGDLPNSTDWFDSQNYKFGLGFSIRTTLSGNELGSIGEYGWSGYWETWFLINPKEEMVIVFMSNLKPGHDIDLYNKLFVLAYQAILE
jgi:CubicO group peptidase (beta-lactamase class C family)